MRWTLNHRWTLLLVAGVAFTAGRFLPLSPAAAAAPERVRFDHDGTLLWVSTEDAEARFVVMGWAKEDWEGAPAGAPILMLAKNGEAHVPVPLPVESIDYAIAYQLTPIAEWNERGSRPCDDGPFECDFFPVPPKPPRMTALGLVPP